MLKCFDMENFLIGTLAPRTPPPFHDMTLICDMGEMAHEVNSQVIWDELNVVKEENNNNNAKKEVFFWLFEFDSIGNFYWLFNINNLRHSLNILMEKFTV